MASKTVSRRRDVELASILDSPEITQFIEQLENARWTGRPGYSIRSLLGVALVKSIYSISTWSRTVALVHEHDGIQRALSDVPSVYAAYRFAGKLTKHKELLDDCISRVLDRLKAKHPSMGENISIDASDLPAYSSVSPYTNIQGDAREPDQYSDMDASWGYRTAVATRKSKWFYGHKVHMAVCNSTGLPLAWNIKTASEKEMHHALPLLDTAIRRQFPIQTVALDKGYDIKDVYEGCLIRGTLPIIPKRNLTGTKGVRLSRFLPRDTPRWKELYKGRGSVERAFSQLKGEWAMLPLKIRGLAKVALHVDLTILAKLCCALLA
jgi:hypothetical protein